MSKDPVIERERKRRNNRAFLARVGRDGYTYPQRRLEWKRELGECHDCPRRAVRNRIRCVTHLRLNRTIWSPRYRAKHG